MMPSSFERYMKSFPAFENSLKNNCIFCAVLKSDSVKKILYLFYVMLFFCAVLKSDSVKKIVTISCYSIIIILVNSYFRFQIHNIKNILKRYTMFLFFNFLFLFFLQFSGFSLDFPIN